MGCNNNNNYNPCDPCANNKVNAEIPESVIRLLRYLKDPVLYLHNLYGNFPDGGELGWFAYVVDENKFATWDVELKRWKYMTSDIEKAFAMLANSVNSICMIAQAYKDNITGLNTLHTQKLAIDFDILIKKRDILFAELYTVPVDRALRSEDNKRMEAKYEAFNDAVNQFFSSYQLALNYKHDTSLNGFLLINSTVQSSTSLLASLYENVESTTVLTSAYNEHIAAKNQLNTTISNSLSDSELSADELDNIQAKYKIYNDTISAFIAEYQSIQNTAFDRLEDWLTDTTNGLIVFISAIGSSTETAKAIFEHVAGTTTQKTALKTNYEAFIQTDSELTTAIDNSLSDSKLSSNELRDIITTYQKYNTDLFGFYAELKKLEDSTKQNKLVNTDGTIILTDNANGTTDISAPSTAGDTSIQEDKIAGTKTLQVTSRLVTVTSSAQTNYIGFESKLNSFKLINLSNLEVFVSLDNPQAGANKVIKDALIGQYILPRYSSIEFLKTADGWLVIGLYGVSYFKDLTNATRDYDCNLLVNADGTAKTEEIREIEAIDESSFFLTAAQLNERYPDAVGGFKVIADGALYIKASNYENTWKSLTFTYVE